jgi:hypothetical protein
MEREIGIQKGGGVVTNSGFLPPPGLDERARRDALKPQIKNRKIIPLFF